MSASWGHFTFSFVRPAGWREFAPRLYGDSSLYCLLLTGVCVPLQEYSSIYTSHKIVLSIFYVHNVLMFICINIDTWYMEYPESELQSLGSERRTITHLFDGLVSIFSSWQYPNFLWRTHLFFLDSSWGCDQTVYPLLVRNWIELGGHSLSELNWKCWQVHAICLPLFDQALSATGW